MSSICILSRNNCELQMSENILAPSVKHESTYCSVENKENSGLAVVREESD